LAGAVAFRLFLFMVPFVYVAFTLLGLAAETANQDPGQLARTIGITGVLASAVVSGQDLSGWTQAIVLTGVTIALVLTARSLLKALYVVHWLVWRIPRSKPKGVLPVFMVIGLAVVFAVLGVALNDLRNANGLLGAILGALLVALAAFLLWWWISWHLPHGDVKVTELIPGAGLMAGGVVALHLLTTYWIAHLVVRKSNAYGAVGVALAVLFWVYILGRVMVGSAGLNSTLWHRREMEDPVTEGFGN